MPLKRSTPRGALLNKLKRRYLFFINAFLLIVPACFISCKKNYKIALENSIRRYISGDKNSFNDIEENLVNSSSILKIQVKKKPIISKLALTQDKENYEAIYPLNFKISKTKMNIRMADYNNTIVVLSDGMRIFITEKDGKIVKRVKPGNKDSLIKDILLIETRIIYYLDEKLCYYDYMTGETGIIYNEKLSPPYNKYYTVSLSRAGTDNISVVAGAGGVYYLYIYNSAAGDLRLNKYTVSTPKLLYSENKLFLIKGNAGNWKLVKMNIISKKEDVLDEFSNISDIELIPEGYLYHIDDTLWYKDFQGNKTRFPFKYRISGILNNHAVLKYQKCLFVINWEKIYGKIKHFKMVIPEIFTEKKGKSPKNI